MADLRPQASDASLDTTAPMLLAVGQTSEASGLSGPGIALSSGFYTSGAAAAAGDTVYGSQATMLASVSARGVLAPALAEPATTLSTALLALFHLGGVALCAIVAAKVVMSANDAGETAEDHAALMQLRYWVLGAAGLLWLVSAACDLSQLGLSRRPLVGVPAGVRLIVFRDHWFYTTITWAMVQTFISAVSGGVRTSYRWGGEEHTWAWVAVTVALLVDLLLVHHRSRQGLHILVPRSLNIAVLLTIVYWASAAVYATVHDVWPYEGQGTWGWLAYVILLLLTVGGFSLARGLTMASLAVQTSMMVYRAKASGQVTCDANVEYMVVAKSKYKSKWHLDVWYPGPNNTVDATTPLVRDASGTRTAGGRPVIVFIHGGMYRFGDRKDARNVGCAWAKAGYIVVVPSYRLLRPNVRMPAPLLDCASAVAWTTRHISDYDGDGSRIFLVGHSAGGHAVTCLATSRRWLSDAGVDRSCIAGVVTVGAARIHKRRPGTSLLTRVLCCCCPTPYRSGASKEEIEALMPSMDIRALPRTDTRGTEAVTDTAARSIPPILLVAGTHEYRPAHVGHAGFLTIAEAHGVRCSSVEMPGEAHISTTLRVGLSDDSLTPLVLGWVGARLNSGRRARHGAQPSR